MSDKLKHAWGDDPRQTEVEARFLGLLEPRQRARERRQAAWRRLALRLRRAVPAGLKRALDLAFAGLLLTVLSPLLALTALAVRLEDGGPVLFVQERIGLAGRPFRMFKFRSMAVDAEQRLAALAARNESTAGVLFKMRQDPRVTCIGRVIRRLSIDELPQLLNVLRGEMSLVGPRPALPREVAQYTQAERARLSVLPGITCLWQVSGRSEIDFQGQVALDLAYIRSQSLAHDLWLLLRTVPAALFGRGAC